MHAKFEVCSFNSFLELLAFNAQKFRGSRDPGDAPFPKNVKRAMSGLCLRTCMPNLKSVHSFNRFKLV